MIDTVVEGDRVRVVLQGKVTYASGDWVSVEDEHGFDPTAQLGIVSVERLSPPLPRKPGSVVLSAGRHVFYRTEEGWRSVGEDAHAYPPEVFDRLTVTVLYDAGAPV